MFRRKQTLEEKIESYTKKIKEEKFNIQQTNSVPTLESNLTFGCDGLSFDAVVLYIDMRHSTQLLDEHRRNVIAKIHMTYYFAIVKIAKSTGGEIRSFNGDSLLVFYYGKSNEIIEKAVGAALKMKYAITQIVNPNLDDYSDIDFGIGIDYGSIIATKVGIGYCQNTQDLIWLGDAVNKSTKISDCCKGPSHIGISKEVHSKLSLYKQTKKGKDVWENVVFTYNNKIDTFYKSNYFLRIE